MLSCRLLRAFDSALQMSPGVSHVPGKPRRQWLRSELGGGSLAGPRSREGLPGSAPGAGVGEPWLTRCFVGNNLVNSWEAAEKPFVNQILKEVLNSLGHSLSTELCRMSQMENKVTSVST